MTDIDNAEAAAPENELAKRRFVLETTERIGEVLGYIAHAYQALHQAGIPTKDWLPLVLEHLPEPHRARFLQGSKTSGAAAIDLAAVFIQSGPVAAIEAVGSILSRGKGDGSPSPGFAAGASIATGALRMLFGPRFGIKEDASEPGDPGDDTDGDDTGADAETDTDRISRGIDGSISAARMRLTILRLFETAPRMTNPDGSPDTSQAPALPCHVVLRTGAIPPLEGVLSTTPEGGLRFLSPVEVEDKDADTSNLHPRAPKPTKTVLCEQFFDYADVVAILVQRDIKATPGSGIVS